MAHLTTRPGVQHEATALWRGISKRVRRRLSSGTQTAAFFAWTNPHFRRIEEEIHDDY